MGKRVTLGHFDLGAFEAFDEVMDLTSLKGMLPKVSFRHLLYSSAIQSGADQILLPSEIDVVTKNDSFLRSHVSTYGSEKTDQVYREVSKVFFPFEEGLHIDDKKRRTIWSIERTIIALLVAMQERSSILMTLPLPKPEEIAEALPANAANPIVNLLNSFENVTIRLPLPMATVKVAQVEIFNEILGSSLFKVYSASQSTIDEAKKRKGAITQVGQSAQDLYNHFKLHLDLSSIGISLMELSTKAIDTIFGHLPGALADLTTGYASKALKDRKRIALYDGNVLFQRVMMQRISELDAFGHKLSKPTD